MGTLKRDAMMRAEIGELGRKVHRLGNAVDSLVHQVELITHQVNDPQYQFKHHEVDIGELTFKTFGLNQWFLLDGQQTLNPNLGMTIEEAYIIGEAVAHRLKENTPFDAPEMIRNYRTHGTVGPVGEDGVLRGEVDEEPADQYEPEQNTAPEGADAVDTDHEGPYAA